MRQAQRESYGWWRRLRWYQKTDDRDGQWLVLRRRLSARSTPAISPSALMGRSSACHEINWGILPGGGATKVVADLMTHARCDVHDSLTGENDGRTRRPPKCRLVNESRAARPSSKPA